MSIWITGDIHGNPIRLSEDNFYEQKDFDGNQDENFVIICGDFGLIWDYKGENKNEKKWLDWLEDKPFTTLFIDGNHECFDRLNAYPVEQWHGGEVHKIRNHVIHLMRGQIFEIEDKKIFTFGGASSHDMKDGIINLDGKSYPRQWMKEAKQWDAECKQFRIRNVSWWMEELPSQEEMDEGIENLSNCNWNVDYVITHSPSASMVALLGHGCYQQDILTKYLETIRIKTNYKRWFCGHMHVNKAINDKDIILYEQIIRIT